MANPGYCRIDPEAAMADISKINRSIELIGSANQALAQLESRANEMRGKTPAAISEKSQELQKRLGALLECLQQSIMAINNAVEEYQSNDISASGIFR